METLVQYANESSIPSLVNAIIIDDVKAFHLVLSSLKDADKLEITFKQNPNFPLEVLASKPPIICVCALFGAIQCLTYLKFLKWNINTQDSKKKTPIMFSIAGGRHDVFEYLIKLGADTNNTDFYGANILHYAVKYNILSITQYIVENNLVDINKQTTRGASPLMWCAQFGDPSTMDYLTNHGSDPNMKTSGGWGLIHYAASTNNIENLKYLISKGFDVNQQINNHSTPLSMAIRENSLESVIILIENGASLKLEENNVDSIFSYAAINNNTEMMNLLLEKTEIEVTIKDIIQIFDYLCQKQTIIANKSNKKDPKPSVETLSNLFSLIVSKFTNEEIKQIELEKYIYSLIVRKLDMQLITLFADFFDINWDFQNPDDTSKSFFLCAAIVEYLDCMDFLKSKGCNIYRKDCYGVNAVSHAQQNAKEKVKAKLRNYGVPF
ncbi:hypothetical protein TVAG_463720 [Trichomonas vaginalis G3]|uniref:Uncharacterized protein n=1 Tax=Trichomonas vaginalis (strain ATCC PRA-98 / G3) TaxID=412133 RepID=A2E225_TRIV3|nr:histone-lysine N-methyltransferase family [Trichomonas vaginalis G3]EAY13239.1 hypothetical protein TVAG_463720 [Trichomonas vaginalis G3]KAI5494102.1 histone-lysine N-methyltransferase family [Trichomonas vaginalis G3]|eukprot:XP_001325462.1 hypothetical protein [Trichomonas vaginalis G3]